MSAPTEPTADESEAETHVAEQSCDDQSKSETSMLNNQTQPAMLEDEEMPTYISVSSPSRRDDSDMNNAKQQDKVPMEEDHSRSPYPSDDQGGGSVYVLSSEEEGHPSYSDEEEDEYRDSEDMDDMDLENEQEGAMIEEEEEEEEEEEDDDKDETPLRMQHDDKDVSDTDYDPTCIDRASDDKDELHIRMQHDKDFSDTDYDPDCIDRASDDIILSNRLKKQPKERSLSLQDLSICKNNVRSPFNKEKHSSHVLWQTYLTMEERVVMDLIAQKRASGIKRFDHVESKVKQYIKDLKEHNRKSLGKRIKDQEHRNRVKGRNEDESLALTSNKTIKDYAEKAIKDLQHDENDENDNTENEKIPTPFDQKAEKQNGPVNLDSRQIQYQNSLQKNMKIENVNDACVMNGHQQASVFNVRTLSYEEYMHGVPGSVPREEMGRQANFHEDTINKKNIYGSTQIIPITKADSGDTHPMVKIDNIMSMQTSKEKPKRNNEPTNVKATRPIVETTEVINLKTQLNQKTAQLDNLRDAYQKTLAENLKMKQELDMLRAALASRPSESKPCETKVASVQTETVADTVVKQKAVNELKETDNKALSSSVASTITTSSIEPWTDSACSPPISIKPPDVATVLNSDDSLVLTDPTPRRTSRSASRAFLTSSRILQTLSNITQGKAGVECLLTQSSKKDKQPTENPSEHEFTSESKTPSSSKKRKATDMSGPSTFLQPFKIPHTSAESHRRRTSSNIDVELKTANETADLKAEARGEFTVSNANNSKLNCTDSNNEHADDQPDNVKCFVYREDEDSEDRSFLIQAEEPAKERTIKEKGRIRECGPYLLGNVEVRMSEVNGTISIWGKEVSQTSAAEQEDDLDTSLKPEKKSCSCWQNTPLSKLNDSVFACSTNRKPKMSARLATHSPQCSSHSPLLSALKSTFIENDAGESRCANVSDSSACEKCHPATLSRVSVCKHLSTSQEKTHSNCLHHTESTELDHGCAVQRDKLKCNETLNCNKDRCSAKCSRRSSYKNTPNSNKCSFENLENSATEDVEMTCKHNTCRCSLQNVVESCPQHVQCYNSSRDNSYGCKTYSANKSHNECVERHSCNLNHSHEEDALLASRRSHETPEVRQRRLRGKRVRGILMDLFRGCGDCRSANINGSKSTTQHKEASCLSNGVQYSKISACDPDVSCTSGVPPAGRCCSAYARRIESQLEEFRLEMERVRSRSDAILDMLSMLHSVDMN